MRGQLPDPRHAAEDAAVSSLHHAQRVRRKSILPEVDGIGARMEPRVTRLHSRARAAIRDGQYDLATELYNSILYRMPRRGDVSPATIERTYLLLALHEQRKGRVDVARRIFNEGIVHFPHSTKLLVALALMESKNGYVDKAIKLVKKAAVRNPERCAMVLKWKIFQPEAPTTA
uniref:Tetratricopeptide repeat protein n=1 Tax=Pinguiococcus pyrenoidosus TaxID=172671 RepID=A0A7R9UDI7_9STRA